MPSHITPSGGGPEQWRFTGNELAFARNRALITFLLRDHPDWRFVTVSVSFEAALTIPGALLDRYPLREADDDEDEEEWQTIERQFHHASFRAPMRDFARYLFNAQGPRERPEWSVERICEHFLGWSGGIAHVHSLTVKRGAD